MKWVFLTIILPFLGALLLYLLPKKSRGVFSVVLSFLTFLASVITLLTVLKYKSLVFTKQFNSIFNFSFLCDGLSVVMAVISCFVSFLIMIYSLDYMRQYKEKDRFYFWSLFFVASMMGLLFSSNLVLLYCFWELTALCSWRLICFYRKELDTKSANRAFLTTFFGASFLLIAIILIYFNYKTLELTKLTSIHLPNSIAFLILLAILSKSAQLPFSSWLPDAGVAPTPVTALLHAAVLVKIGIYAFARLFNLTFITTDYFLSITLLLSIITIIVSASAALQEANIKRILAYSTISQLGYIIFILTFRDSFALKIALLYVLAHSLAKAGLFLCAGTVEHKTHTKDLNQLSGLIKNLPITATSFLLCAFSIIGLPPLLGFWPKLFLVFFSLSKGKIFATTIAVFGAFFTLLYLFRFFFKVFLGEPKYSFVEDQKFEKYSNLAFAILSVFFGFSFLFWFNFLDKIL